MVAKASVRERDAKNSVRYVAYCWTRDVVQINCGGGATRRYCWYEVEDYILGCVMEPAVCV